MLVLSFGPGATRGYVWNAFELELGRVPIWYRVLQRFSQIPSIFRGPGFLAWGRFGPTKIHSALWSSSSHLPFKQQMATLTLAVEDVTPPAITHVPLPDSEDNAIYFFGTSGPHGALSNFAFTPFRINGVSWSTVENYYQVRPRINSTAPLGN